MKPIVLIAVLVAAVAASDYPEDIQWTDYRLLPEEFLHESDAVSSTLAPEEEVCKKVGFACDGCDKLIYCNLVGGEWQHMDVQDCSQNGLTCNVDKCSSVPSADCDKRKFTCTSNEGVYPDPVSCKKYHYCVPCGGKFDPITRSCPKGWSYNSRTTYCDKRLGTNDTCAGYPVPLCNNIGETAALKDNPSLYYVCLPAAGGSSALYPFLYLCPNGEIYDPKTGSCK